MVVCTVQQLSVEKDERIKEASELVRKKGKNEREN